MTVMGALVRYQLALLLRSQRWLAPLLLYAGLLSVGVRPGEPLLDSLGLVAALLLPPAAWLVRICVTSEPDAARHCASAAAGPTRAHLAAVAAGGVFAAVLGCAGVGVVVAISAPKTTNGTASVPVAMATVAGLCAVLTCVFAGVAVGTLCNRPLVRSPGRAVSTTLLGTILTLALGASPANAAVTGLVRASSEGTPHAPWFPLLTALALALTTATAAALTTRHRA